MLGNEDENDVPIPVEAQDTAQVEQCPACAEPVAVGANWCEACGHDLVGDKPFINTDVPNTEVGSAPQLDPESTEPSAPCQACGETDIDAEGYCLSCGYRQPSERNHVGEVVGPVAAATDRGSVRHRNEDAFAIAVAVGGQAVMVVCDGVSSTPGSEEASTSAAAAACESVVHGLNQHEDSPPDASQMEQLLRDAVADAQQAATAAAETVQIAQGGAPSIPLADPPSTTLVCAVVSVDASETDAAVELDVAWVGDSRCYWVTGDNTLPLTTDHEELQALSRWLGADSINPTPDVARHRFPLGAEAKPGWVLVCSDGLWRYLTPSTGMPAHELVAALGHNLARPGHLDESNSESNRASNSESNGVGETARQLVDGLVEFANNRGGHDNITAAITSPAVSLQQPTLQHHEESQ